MAIYFLVTTSSDRHLFTQCLPQLRNLGIESEVCDLEEFDRLESHLDRKDILVARALGGMTFQRQWLEAISRKAHERGIHFASLPGFNQDDPSVLTLSTVPLDVCRRLLDYFETFNETNVIESVKYLSDIYLGSALGWEEPERLPEFNILPGSGDREFFIKEKQQGKTILAILFYRSHFLAGDDEPVQNIIEAIRQTGSVPMPVFCLQMRQPSNVPHPLLNILKDDAGETIPHVILDCLSHSSVEIEIKGNVSRNALEESHLFSKLDRPVVHGLYSSESKREWETNPKGMNPPDMAMKVVLPEFDGKVIAQPVAFVEKRELEGKLTPQYKGHSERIQAFVALANRWAQLSTKPNRKKKIALVLTNYPTDNARIGNAVGLDSPQSLVHVLETLRDSGFDVGPVPKNGDALIHSLINQCSYDLEYVTEDRIAATPAQLDSKAFRAAYQHYPEPNRQTLEKDWGEPPGRIFIHRERFFFPGLFFGNVFVGIQPPRGFGENPVAVYHNPELSPTHHYLAFYEWLRDEFQADAIVHLGKHGNLEWLPGKAVALSAGCYPELAIQNLPFFYYFIINNPGEGTQAKRRTHSVLIDHMVPPMTRADLYGDLAQIEQLIEEWTHIRDVDPAKLSIIQSQIWELCEARNINRDLKIDTYPEKFENYRKAINGYLCEVGNTQIRGGLHILARMPEGKKLIDLLVSLARVDTPPYKGTQTLFMEVCGIEATDYFNNQAEDVDDCTVPDSLLAGYGNPVGSRGELLKLFDHVSFRVFEHCLSNGLRSIDSIQMALQNLFQFDASPWAETFSYFLTEVCSKLEMVEDELTHLVRGLEGRFVPPGPSGSPTRGMASILPTGRNFYSVDIQSIPTITSWEMGKRLAVGLLDRYRNENGRYPESVALVLWGTSNMRTKGDDIAQILYLLGVKPVWKPENKRVAGIEVIPLEELGRPRIDVGIRISGFFRDAFQNLVCLMDEALARVARLDEPVEMNFVRKHYLESQDEQLYRIFSSAPGRYGTGILETLHAGNWDSQQDLAEVFLSWGGHAYTREEYGVSRKDAFRHQLARMEVAAQNQDNREHDIFDSDDYLQFHGGMINAINQLRAAQGKSRVTEYFGDSSNPAAVRVKTLQEEVRVVFRARVVNPKWIEAMRPHGYKGALEMAATVDYLFGYDATTNVVEDHMYEEVAQTYLLDPENQKFLKEKNPWALQSMGRRLIEAAHRGMWKNPDTGTLMEIETQMASIEGDIEDNR